MTQSRVLCYGEIGLDIYLKLDCLPTLNRAGNTQDEFENVGGAAANSAMWLANWGIATRLLGHDLGDDRAGDTVRGLLGALEHLDTTYVACHAGYRSPRCQCLVTPDGERSFIMHWLDELRVTDLEAGMLRGIEWLNLDMSGPLEPRLRAARLAAEREIPVLINDIYATDHALLPYVDVLVISASIARGRTPGSEPLALAQRLQQAGDCHVIVTDAAAAVALLMRGGEKHQIQPLAVAAVDTTGAGDTFKAGLLYGLLRDLPLPEAARWGCAAASLMCRFPGATRHLADLDAVAEYLP
ncbi:MAG: carbohydrate kinase family protein [Chloroflexota bacterium]|nr:carbohydrate kinase family protein [Chloroflexota bacterium]